MSKDRSFKILIIYLPQERRRKKLVDYLNEIPKDASLTVQYTRFD